MVHGEAPMKSTTKNDLSQNQFCKITVAQNKRVNYITIIDNIEV